MDACRRCFGFSAFAFASSAFAQGDLTPPGKPAATMKTLDQIDIHIDVKGEKRIDLQNAPAAAVTTTNASYHFIIAQPGSYYLSANLAVTKTNGIEINAEGVTLDLNGFQISRTTSVGTGNGIEIAGISNRASVRNGSITGFAYGVNSIGSAKACGFRDLSVSSCTTRGISAGRGAVLESCRAHDNSGNAGIFADLGSTLTNCAAYDNTTNQGILVEVGSSLTNCTARDNTAAFGIFAGPGSSLTNCSASSNQSSATTSGGIEAGNGSTISHCTARFNSSTAATFTSTTGMGFSVESGTIQGCTAYSNRGDGIRIFSESIARDNSSNRNGSVGDGAGIHAAGTDNRIEGNNVTANDRGIVSAVGNVVIKNTARGNTTNYSIAAGNIYGAIVDRVIPAGSPTPAPVNGNSAASSANTTDPWANIAY